MTQHKIIAWVVCAGLSLTFLAGCGGIGRGLGRAAGVGGKTAAQTVPKVSVHVPLPSRALTNSPKVNPLVLVPDEARILHPNPTSKTVAKSATHADESNHIFLDVGKEIIQHGVSIGIDSSRDDNQRTKPVFSPKR